MPRAEANAVGSDRYRHTLQVGKGKAVLGEVPEATTATLLPFWWPQTGFPEMQSPDVEEGGRQRSETSDWRRKGK